MISVDIACDWPDQITISSGQHGELRLSIPVSDSEGMDGGTVTVIFTPGDVAMRMLTSEIGRISDLLGTEAGT